MARYDWPVRPRGEDRALERADYLARLRPGIDPLAMPPVPRSARGRSRRAVPHTMPVGVQDLWFPIGPTVMSHGQAGGDPNVAGRISDVQIEPTSGQRLYAAAAGGGVWFSANGGRTWSPLDDFQLSDLGDVHTIASALSCGAIGVDWHGPADGSGDVVWVGTGEARLAGGGLTPAQPAGGGPGGGLPGGNLLGVGLLRRDPAINGGAWEIVKGDPFAADHETLRGAAFYRIAPDPTVAGQFVAGTTHGLYALPRTGSWTRVTSWAMQWDTHPMDVVLTHPAAGRLRVWVASASALSVAEVNGADANPLDPTKLAFTTVALPDVAKNPMPNTPGLNAGGTRIALAAAGSAVYVLGRQLIPARSARTEPAAALWVVDATAATAGLTATKLSEVPEDVFMSTGDQSDYDMAIAADPSVAGRVFIGGATVSTPTGYNAALYRCDTKDGKAHPTLIGEGVHADVHALRVWPAPPATAAKHTVWVGCDGGLFRSDSDGDPGSFADSNDGLAVLEPGFVASHPTNPGIVVAGFQDNGTARRIGDSVWKQDFAGDGGGVVFDPTADRYFRQYNGASWNSSDGTGVAPVYRRNARAKGTLKTSETIEGKASLFYSGTSSVVHGGDTHLVVGTDRVWYTRDWGRSWVTLPTASDPRDKDNPDLAQDVLDVTSNPAYSDTVGSTDCCASTYTGPGASGVELITVKLSAAPNDANGKLVLRAVALLASDLVWMVGSRVATDTGAFSWTPLKATPRQQVRVPRAGAETNALKAGDPLRFLPTPNIVSDLTVHDPARGVLGSCYVTTLGFPLVSGADTMARDTLWWFDGTDTWVQTGLRNVHPNGTWPNNDRVTAPAFGVLVDPDDKGTVYVATSVGVLRGTLVIGGTNAAPTYAWTWSRFMNGLPTAAVQDLSLFSSGGLKLLRAATQSRGVWEIDLVAGVLTPRTYLRVFATDTRRVLPTPTGGPVLSGTDPNPTHWDDSPDIVVDTTGATWTAPPTEVQLGKLPSAGGATDRARVSSATRHLQVHVLVHHRWSDAVKKEKVKVALLRHDLPANGVVPIGQLWPQLVAVAAPAAAQPAALQDGWTRAGTDLWLHPQDDIDTRVPRAVTFDVDLSAGAKGETIVFLAVVMSELDQISVADLSLGGAGTAQSGFELITSSPHAAAKSFQLL
jgi:hypothetical protein